MMERAVKALFSSVFHDGDPAFNFSVYWGQDAKGQEKNRQAAAITAAANEYPFLTAWRMLVIRDADQFAGMEPLHSYLKNPSPSTILVLCTAETRKRARKKALTDLFDFVAAQEAKSTAALVEFKMREQDLPKWIADEAAKYGKQLPPDSIDMLIALKGGTLREIAGEVEKLDLAFPDKENIMPEDVAALVGSSRSYTVFQLSDAVLKRKGALAQEIAQRLVEEKQATSIVRDLFRSSVLLWKTWQAVKGKRRADVEWRKLGFTSDWQFNLYRSEVDKYRSASYFEMCFAEVLQAELQLKSSSQLDDGSIIARLVYLLTDHA